MPQTAEQKKALEQLIPEYHPMVVNPTSEEVLRYCESEQGRLLYARLLQDRERLIKLAESEEDGDPFRYGWELPHYKIADKALKSARGQYCGGGKRATKSERAAKRVVKSAMMLPRSKIWCFQGNDHTSKAEQQPLIWKYLPKEIKALNGRARHGWAKINYNPDIGFANRVLVLPNQSQIHFLTYNQDPKEYQGWKLGAPLNRALVDLIEREEDLFNLGAWLDEDATIPWLDTVETRCTTNRAVWLWTFSTMEGITPAVGSIVLGAQTQSHARAELIPGNLRACDDCPPGHMPITQRSRMKPTISIVYFWTEWNPFGNNYAGVKETLEGKPIPRITQDAYGYSKETKRRAYPKFGLHNIVEPDQLPAEGTNFQVLDLAGSRSWCALWARFAPGNPGKIFIYRDWPDCQTYGEWAVPGPTNDHPDGVGGNAQKSQGFGWGEYKQQFLDLETHSLSGEALVAARSATTDEQILEALKRFVPDPQMRDLFLDALKEDKESPLVTVKETVAERLIDPRAAKDQKHADSGSTTPQDELAKPQTISWNGRTVQVPGLEYRQASGVSHETGFTEASKLLSYDTTKPVCHVVNEPLLYVTSNCLQVIQCLMTYTSLGGEKGGWKDFSDLVRYLVTSGLEHVDPKIQRASKPFGGF